MKVHVFNTRTWQADFCDLQSQLGLQIKFQINKTKPKPKTKMKGQTLKQQQNPK